MRALALLLVAGCGAGVAPEEPCHGSAVGGWSLLAGAWGTDVVQEPDAGLLLNGHAALESAFFPLAGDAGFQLELVFRNDDGATVPDVALGFYAGDAGASSAATGFQIPAPSAGTSSTWCWSSTAPAGTELGRVEIASGTEGAGLHLEVLAVSIAEACQ